MLSQKERQREKTRNKRWMALPVMTANPAVIFCYTPCKLDRGSSKQMLKTPRLWP
jgi:hypothetical protein